MSSRTGPLGNIAGMQWDPMKNKYFPASAAPSKAPTGVELARMRGIIPMGPPARGRTGQNQNIGRSGVGEAGSGRLAGQGLSQLRSGTQVRFDEQPVASGKRRKVEIAEKEPRRSGLPRLATKDGGNDGVLQGHFEQLSLTTVHHICGCCNDHITSLQSYRNDSYVATTTHGMVVQYESGDGAMRWDGCSAGAFISTFRGLPPYPHIHIVKRHPDAPDATITDSDDVPGSRTKDMYAVSGFEGRLTVASNKALHTLSYDLPELKWSTRRMPSDPLAVSHVDRHLVYAGLRNGTAHLVDLRSQPTSQAPIVRSLAGKAIVGVKKLDDSAVPHGLVISAMNHEMLIFDARFPSQPLHVLDGHHNPAFTDLGWATSASDRFLFAASARSKNDGTQLYENTLNAWDTTTGDRLVYNPSDDAGGQDKAKNAHAGRHEAASSIKLFERKFPSRIRALAVREGDLGVDVSSGGSTYRFGPLCGPVSKDEHDGRGGMGLGGHHHHYHHHGGEGDDGEDDDDDDGFM